MPGRSGNPRPSDLAWGELDLSLSRSGFWLSGFFRRGAGSPAIGPLGTRRRTRRTAEPAAVLRRRLGGRRRRGVAAARRLALLGDLGPEGVALFDHLRIDRVGLHELRRRLYHSE